jgi:hypothetical protein
MPPSPIQPACVRTGPALERIGFLLADWQAAAVKLVDTETRMVAVLDQLQLTELATSIPGVSAVGAAAILAETGVIAAAILRQPHAVTTTGRAWNPTIAAHGTRIVMDPPIAA